MSEAFSNEIFKKPFGTQVDSSEGVFGQTANFLLKEDGDKLQKENGDFILLE